MKRIITFIFALSILVVLFTVKVETKASSYNYNFYSNPIYSSEGLSYKDTMYYDYMFENSPFIENYPTSPYFLKRNQSNFTSLADISIDEATGNIYMIDCAEDESKTFSIKVKVTSGGSVVEDTAELQKNSILFVLNNEFKAIYCRDVFKISQQVQDTLASYYGISNDPTQFTKAQIESPKTLESEDRRCPFFCGSVDGGETYETLVYLYNAQGLYFKDNYLFIADTMNSRIFRLDISQDYLIDRVYLTPNDVTFYQLSSEEDQSTAFVFQPAKIGIDSDGRVYTISSNTYQGIIEYKQNGEFNRFLGKNLVTQRSWWTFLLTEEQYQNLALNLPSQFTNLVIDDRDLIYATARPNRSATTASEMIKLINASGSDVLIRNGYVKPDGDIKYQSYVKPAVTGSSIFVGITVNKARIFSAVDQTRGRIFTYDDEGNLLYISGSQGNLSNHLKIPTAITYYNQGGSEYVLVLDRGSKSLIIFETTEFGKLVNEATELYLKNEIDAARVKWEEVVKMNSNYELGYVGIGKSILRNANTATNDEDKMRLYKEAMDYFTLGHNKNYYSNAYKQYRNMVLKQNFALMMTGFVIVAVLSVTITVIAKRNKKMIKIKQREEVENNGKRNI